MRVILFLLSVSMLTSCVHRKIDKCNVPDPHPECPKCLADEPDPSCPNYVAPMDMAADMMLPNEMDTGPDADMTTPEDIGLDKGPDVDPNACDPACEDPTAVCDEGVCVECILDDDCPDGVCTDQNVCVECIDACDSGHCFENVCVECYQQNHCGQQRCLVDQNICVDCLVSEDCISPDASVCGPANACEACVDDAGCLGVDNRCDEGVCVECTIATEATDCGGKSCDPATNECTTTDVGTVGVCEACVADSECGMNARCIKLKFQSMTDLGGYCFNTFTSGCSRPYASRYNSPSVSGAPAEDYCGIDVTRTTCEAIADMISDTSCTSPDDCGVMGIEDGLCETVSGLSNRCTYRCVNEAECNQNRICTGGYCQ